MRGGRPLLKLPVRFCGDTLAREVEALPANAWIEHPQKYDGNTAVVLISPGGAITQLASGPMGPTQWLRQCPYVGEILQALDTTWGRSRLMGLEAGAEVPEHVDVHYYWRTHLRVHIPVITNPGVAFTCAGETIHMKPGECWLLDSFYRHSVVNSGTENRVHLVLDTVGSAHIWDLIETGLSNGSQEKFIGPGETQARPIAFEQVNSPLVMSPWELKSHVQYIREWTDPQPGRDRILALMDRFVMAWSGSWARYGISEEGLPAYIRHLQDVHGALSNFRGPEVLMRNEFSMLDALQRFVLSNAIDPSLLRRIQMGSSHGRSVRMTA